MPATRQKASLITSRGRVVPVKWKSRCVGLLDTSVESIIKEASAYFRLQSIVDELVLVGTIDGVEMELTDDSLPLALSPKGGSVVLTRVQQDDGDLDNKASGGSSEASFNIYAKTMTGRRLTLQVKGSTTVEALQEIIRDRLELPSSKFCKVRPIFMGNHLKVGHRLSDYSLTDGCTIHIITLMSGGKPVIYLFPPAPIPSATVAVHLHPQWSFTHLYPLPTSERLPVDGSHSATWSVSASPDGTLVERSTGLELSYLFWEADTDPRAPPSPIEPNTASEHFDPAYPRLTPDFPTTVLLPFAELLPYLDRALNALSLHTAARNDFITYWLPKLSKAPYVALRFLPQRAYERAAELTVEPRPDVVTRVFMLFRGVAADEAASAEWEGARARVEKVDWVDVVGVRGEAWDGGLFRVLEWGAMEVL